MHQSTSTPRNACEYAQAHAQAQFEGRAFAGFKESCKFIGIAEQTGRHRLMDGTFPLPVTRTGGKLLVPVAALLAFTDQMLAACGIIASAPEPANSNATPSAPPSPAPVKRGRGRPRKMQQIGGAL